MADHPPSDIDYGRLAEFLAALAYPARLELLRVLRSPHIASEIRLSPLRIEEGGNPERSASKQTIQAHLDKLVDADLVRTEPAVGDARKRFLYTVNSQQLYAVTEELRRVSTLYAGSGAVGELTGTLKAESPSTALPAGPRLVLVHGLYEGRSYPLTGAGAQTREWRIGRRRGLDVSLDYDPYVSLENARIVARGQDIAVEDLSGKNGTSVNWKRLASGERRALVSGDVIGVGRSLLVFRDR